MILSSKRLCIDITASGSYYTINFDGGMHLDMTVVETMKRADFLLGAFAFGRDGRSGVLFKPKEGQLLGYKNPILESARLLVQDAEYAAARCQYSIVWLQPALLSDRPFTMPSSKWWDWWPEIDFPMPVLRLTWRLVLVDLFGTQEFYDVPDVPDEAHAEAKVLLRPYQAAMESFQKHGAAWIASEPDLTKIEWYAKLFQVSSLARASSTRNHSVVNDLLQNVLPAKASSRTVYERADFINPQPDSNEVDVFNQALETAFTVAITTTSDDLERAAKYQQLGQSCFRLKKYDSAIVYILEAAGVFDQYIQKHLSDAKLDRSSTLAAVQRQAKDGLRECFGFALESILLTSTDWVLQKSEQANSERKFPAWWTPLHGLFAQALEDVDKVLAEPRFKSMTVEESPERARIATTLVLRVLLVRLGHEMLAKFGEIQDLSGILCVCLFMARLYEKMKEEREEKEKKSGTRVDASFAGAGVGAGRTRWASIEQVSREVNGRLFSRTVKADLFNVLEMVLRGDFVGDGSTSQAKQRSNNSNRGSNNSRTKGMDYNPLSDLTEYDNSSSKSTPGLLVPDSKFAQAELTMDTYFIEGNIAASLACAFVLVQDEEIASLSTHDDCLRLWTKASVIAEFAVAQRDLQGAKALVEGVRKTIAEVTYRTTGGTTTDNKAAMLSYLTEACTLLTAHGTSLLPRASAILMSRAQDTMANVHRAWFDAEKATKWTVVAEALQETAKEKNDVLGPTSYACRWLLDERRSKEAGAVSCTRGWHAMTAALV
ncbi:hypothetical protein BGW39_007871 [Mortierella sp. 14UC]|nr:hypothetical protein BGW39_007871 [Mortierella sp. 14UC]